MNYFFDSYAFLEIIDGKKNYEKYQEVEIITTKLNLMEVHYAILRKKGKEIADKYFERFNEYCIEIDDETIKKANDFKLKMKEKNLSYIDCIGYVMALSRGIKFLTGDKEFLNLPNVEFVR